MKKEAITIKDIARALGISTSSVSRALRDSWEISVETKQRVKDYARENNYRPNPVALGLKERRTMSIGVIVSQIANSFFSQVLNGIESVAYANGYNIMIFQTHESSDREITAIQNLVSRSVDGLLVSVTNETIDYSIFSDLIEREFPIVFFDRVIPGLGAYKITADNFEGAYKATSYLISKGYKHIACLCNSENLLITHQRVEGYQKALADHHIEFNEKLLRYFYRSDSVEESLNELMAAKVKPDAVLSLSDWLTVSTLRHLKLAGVKVPEEVAILGYSNSQLTDLVSPPLSVIVQPAFEMGKLAAEYLIKLVETKRPITEYETRVLSSTMYIRESTL